MLDLVFHPDGRPLLLSAVEDRPDTDMKRLAVGARRPLRLDGDYFRASIVVKVAPFHRGEKGM